MILGIDVGGTFTDLVCLTGSGELIVEKTPSTPTNPGEDVVDGIRRLAVRLDLSSEQQLVERTSLIFHGSTIATNALLTRSGGDVGMITTDGFKDIVEMRGGIRESTFDSALGNAPPLAPRHLRMEIAERTDRYGTASLAPNEPDVRKTALDLRRMGAAAVAVCFKHAYANPQHEESVVRSVCEVWPDVFITRSTELTNRIRLYDRASTAVVNSYVGPQTDRYLGNLVERLKTLGFGGLLLIMGSNGGVMAPAEGRRFPAKLLLSGPSAGPVAASMSLSTVDRGEAVVIDMGGTSFDVSVLQSGRVRTVAQRDVNRYRVSVPMSDIHTVGAGGGSIAWLDPIGLLKVGPNSAGSVPGPACYGRGGEDPTVTDSNLVLGYLDPEAVLGGKRRLSLQLARRAIKSKIADPLDTSTEEAALGIHRVATAFMTAAVREMTLGKGIDPRQLPLVIGGGAGGLHGAEIAEGLGIEQMIVPRHGGVLCALGMAVGEVKYDTNVTIARRLDDIDPGEIERVVHDMKQKVTVKMRETSSDLKEVDILLEVEARYVGQFHDLTLVLDEAVLSPLDRETLRSAFHEAHERAYGFLIDDAAVEVINLRVTAEARFERREITPHPEELTLAGTRIVLLADGEEALAACYEPRRSSERSRGGEISGPALVDLRTSTVLVPPSWTCRIEPSGDLAMSRSTS